MLGVSVTTFVAWAVMLYLGRPAARGIAAVALPPGARGAVAFLWTADGKTPPNSELDTDFTD